MKAQFIATCVSAPAESVNAYDDTARDITYRTFARHVGAETIRELNASFGVPLSKDWHVSFGKGRFEGRPCVCMHHSAIHHFYQIFP